MNILFFCPIASLEIELLNRLHDYFTATGGKLFLVFFETYDADLRLLKIPGDSYIHLESSRIDRVAVPSLVFGNHNTHHRHLEDLFEREREFYHHTRLNRAKFLRKANALSGLTEKLLQVIAPTIVVWGFQPSPAFTIIRNVLRSHGIKYIHFDRWHFPKTYVFSESAIWSADWRKDNIGEDSLENFKTIVKSLFDTATQRYNHSKEERYIHSAPYILFLTSSYLTGTAARSTDEFITLGSGWGGPKECVAKMESVLAKVWPDCELLVREHPFGPKLASGDFSARRTRIVTQKCLEDLICNAQAVVCSYTGLVYYALKEEKVVAVLGHHELEGSGVVTCCHHVKDLQNWLARVKVDKEFRKKRLSDIIGVTAGYVSNRVISLEHKETFRIFDRFDKEGRSEKVRGVPETWYQIRRIVRVYKCYYKCCLFIRSLLWGSSLSRLFGGLKRKLRFGRVA